jgi:hypothetical protein
MQNLTGAWLQAAAGIKAKKPMDLIAQGFAYPRNLA